MLYHKLSAVSRMNLVNLFKQRALYENPRNAVNFNNLITYIRKNKITNMYQTPYFDKCAEFIGNNLVELGNSVQIAAFAFNLSKIKCQNLLPYQKIASLVLSQIQHFDLHSLANIVYAFAYITRIQK